MLTKTMKILVLVSLLSAGILWKYAPTAELPLRFIVALGALLVAVQAVRAKKYTWAVAFYAVMVLFNPFFAFIRLSGDVPLGIVFAASVLFAASLRAIRTPPLASIPSITDRTPGSESL